ncbi:hypothetical protein [Actinoplanes sp. HUAS TT8]|uniref:hypothetical protein n=1 Tax=Actinoplanes sp. HUAS TT8 TaxID=3447453 RepID=UPI003F51C6A6
MISASLPLILVGVVCLAIGLVRGSSSLLIASIVASLLAAVALVIGLRQSAATRRPEAPGMPDALDDGDPPGPAPRRTAGAPDAHDSAPAGAASAADSGFAGDSPYAAGSYASESYATDRSSAAGHTDPIGFPAADEVYEEHPVTDQGRQGDLPRTGEGARGAGTHLTDESVVSPDYRAASSTIGAARGTEADDQAWRRPGSSGPTASADSPAGPTASAESPAGPGTSGYAAGPGTSDYVAGPAGSGSYAASGGSPSAAPSGGAYSGSAGGFPVQGSGPGATDPSLVDEFGEPDADDPDDEPLPQAVQPTDAVQVARLDTEVLVVDGRPRYHMADCPHLVGRLTESLPAAEAVELGFSPCGLCRPVDRLLGANARR